MVDNHLSLSFLQKFFELDPLEAAHHLETLKNDEASELLQSVPPATAARVVDFLDHHSASAISIHLPESFFVEILNKMRASKSVELLLAFSEERRSYYLQKTDKVISHYLNKLLSYPKDSAGRLMSPHFISFRKETKIKEAVQKIREYSRNKALSYVYVTDGENHLAGVLNMRHLLLADSETTVEAIMIKEVFSVQATMDQEEVAHEAAQKRYFALPVVDEQNHLLGTILTDELITSTQEEATEDIQKMFGAGGDERVFSPLSFSIKKRLPWLHINLATAFLAGFVVSLFEGTIGKITALAIFMPVVAGQGGNAGAQSLAVVMRGLVLREVAVRTAWKVISREAFLGMINGLAIGVVSGLAGWILQKNFYFGIVIALAMVFNMVVAGFFGAVVPITMKALGKDPAQSSNIILTTFTDCMGFFAFLGLATLFQSHLLPH